MVASDGSGQTKLSDDAMSAAIWSPDGDAAWQNGAYLLIDSAEATQLFESGTWEQMELPLLEDVRVLDWQIP